MLRNWFRRARPQAESGSVAIELTRIGGPPELELLFIHVAETDIRRGLDAWRWIGLDDLTVIAVAAFGDVVFRAADGGVHLLDTLEGHLRKVAGGISEFTAHLQETESRDGLLFAGLVIGARSRGLLLEPGECYDFRVAPVLGGEISSDAMEKLSLVVKLHLTGLLHEQIKDLPDGTRISGFTITD